MVSKGGSRQRARGELITEIKQIARAQLAREGANLSLRAVTRELGMVSSGIYRYFASRDELLTALIVDAYNALGNAVEQAESDVDRVDYRARLLAVGAGARAWALEFPSEFALIYGSPVPGYRAPVDTIAPAARLPVLIGQVLAQASAAGAVQPDTASTALPSAVSADMAVIGAVEAFAGIDESVLARLVAFYVLMIGLISFELFGHLTNGIDHYGPFFEFQLADALARMGL